LNVSGEKDLVKPYIKQGLGISEALTAGVCLYSTELTHRTGGEPQSSDRSSMNAESAASPNPDAQTPEVYAALSVTELTDVLKLVAKLYSSEQVGNPRTSSALLRLAQALSRFRDQDLDAALNRLEDTEHKRHRPNDRYLQVSSWD
jgi:hypothetical protein